MKKLSTLICGIVVAITCFSQSVGIRASKQFGGNGNDLIYKVIPLPDGGMLTFGNSSSTNIFAGHGQMDAWVTRMDNRRKILWQKALGGSGADGFADVVYNTDGTFLVLLQMQMDVSNNDYFLVKMNLQGQVLFQQLYGGAGNNIPGRLLKVSTDHYLLAGHSNAANLPSFHGGTDVYVVEIKDSANVPVTEWQKTIGGTSYETFKDAQVDGSDIVLMAEADGGGGNIANYHGGADILVAKLSATGTLLWSNGYGGSANEFPSSLVVTNDGGYVFAGNTASFDGDVTGDHGNQDVWAVKLDRSGSIVWARSYGGSQTEESQTVVQGTDGSIYVAAVTASYDGDVVGSHRALVNDLWILKLNNTDGSAIWKKCAGGSNWESYLYSGESVVTKRKAIIADSDGGCVVAGYTNSVDGDVSGLHGTTSNQDVWVIKLSADGKLMWQKCLGGSTKDFVGDFIQNGVNDYSIAIYSNSSDGDMSGTFGGQDALLVKLASINVVWGTVYVDLNGNHTKEGMEPFYPFDLPIQFSKNNDTTTIISSYGYFSFNADTGTYKVQPVPPDGFSSFPVNSTTGFPTYFNKDSLSFALELPVISIKDMVVKVIPLSAARPGFHFDFRLLYANVGTDTLKNVTLKMGKGKLLTISSTTPAYNSTIGDSLYWNLGTVNPFEGFKSVDGSATVSGNAGIGDHLQVLASITNADIDATPANNYDTAVVRITSSYDPNDKEEAHGGTISHAQIQQGQALRYTIRFQNTGTDTAFNVVLKDTLDANLNPSTVRMLASSHPYNLSLGNGNVLTWSFDNINLPDITHNEPLSHGFVTYSVQANPAILAGQNIHNTASIYFDYNAAIKTNDAVTLVQDNFVSLPVQLQDFSGKLQTNIAHLHWLISDDGAFDHFEVERSLGADASFSRVGVVNFAGSKDYSFDDKLTAGNLPIVKYRLKIVEKNGVVQYSAVLAFKISTLEKQLETYPNPFDGSLFLSYNSTGSGALTIQLFDVTGKELMVSKEKVSQGQNVIQITGLGHYKPGLYLVRISQGSVTQSKWITRVGSR